MNSPLKIASAGRLISAAGVLFLAVLAGLIYADFRAEIRAARDRVATGSRIADTLCGPIEYAVAGNGPPVLIVHGAGGGFDQGLELGAPLVARGFRVIAMSRFGYLRTPLPADAPAAAQADAHACLLDALQVTRAAIVGASAGAPSSMQFALRYPERLSALVLLVPAAYVPRPNHAPPVATPRGTALLFDTALRSDFLFWAATRLARGTMINAILATPSDVVDGASSTERERVGQLMDHILPVSTRRLGLLNDSAVISTLERYALERITVPTLAISSADDLYGTFDSARYSAEHIRGARFIGYPSGGHVLVGRQEDVFAEIAAFLAQPRS